MQGRQEYQPELFVTVDIEQMIPKNHLLRRLDVLLDLSFVRRLTAKFYSADNGRPSVDPELFFRMQLIAYFYGIDSDRRLCEEVAFNLSYRWYCKLSLQDEVPDHSSMTKIRDRLGEKTFEKVFHRILKLCEEKGLIQKKSMSVMMDSSLLKADAALKSLVKRDEKGNPCAERENPWHQKGQRYSNQTHVSHSDPDATLTNKTGVHKALYYKVHESADLESRVIVDCHVTTGSIHDSNLFQNRIEAMEENGINVNEMVADRAYGSGENQQYMVDEGINSNVPNFHTEVGLNYDRKKFQYDKKKDRFLCPMGQYLNPIEIRSGKQTATRQYQIRGGHCKTCPLRMECFPRGSQEWRKKINVNIYQSLQDEIRLREQDTEFKSKLWQRMWKIEGLFAEGKTFHTLNRARYRGRWKVQVQAYMVASVQNLKRLMAKDLGGLMLFLEKWFWNLKICLQMQITTTQFQNSILGMKI